MPINTQQGDHPSDETGTRLYATRYSREDQGGRNPIETIPPDEPYCTIGEAARLVELHPQTLRHYEELGLVVPQRSRGNIRLYSPRDIERLRKITRLTQELGVNLAGAGIILRLSEQVEALRTELARMRTSI